jgi:antitoxin ParD1/3/4
MRYDFGMTMEKIAVSLPPELAQAARRAVEEGKAPSVSAYVTRALSAQLRAETLIGLVAEMRAQDGTPSSDDYAWADRALGLT